MKKMCKFVADCVAKRRSRGPGQYKDLFYYLAHEDEPDYKLDLALLQEDASVARVDKGVVECEGSVAPEYDHSATYMAHWSCSRKSFRSGVDAGS